MELCFSKILPKSLIRQDLLSYIKYGEDWIDPTVGTFLQKKPPKDLIFKDPFLKHICENCMSNYGYDESVHIFKIDSWTHYMLHSDRFRSTSINLLINDYTDSISYFQISEPYKQQIKIKELEYEPDTYYLFNSKIPHAITNRTPDRYLFSITLQGTYEDAVKHLKDQKFL